MAKYYTQNREISWLNFNARVLQEAVDKRNPLIERLRFLGIYSNNRDEFFKVRVAWIKRMIDIDKKLPNGRLPKSVLKDIHAITLDQQKQFHLIYRELKAELKKNGTNIINEKELDDEQLKHVKSYFKEKVYPSIFPIMLKKSGAFPELKDKSVYLTIYIKVHGKEENTLDTKFALIEIPSKEIGRFYILPKKNNTTSIIMLDDIIRCSLMDIFKKLKPIEIEAYTIKLTRDAELDIDNDVSESYLEKMQKSLKKRKKGFPVRFVYDKEMNPVLLTFLMRMLELDNDDNLIAGARYHNFKDFMEFPNTGSTELEFSRVPAIEHPRFEPYSNMFKTIAKQDVLLHYPYHSFNNFIDFLRLASIDSKVKTIRITLYRVAPNSKIINALISAAKNGKKVIVALELSARFDEEANIYWSNMLQEEGVKVLLGIEGFKTHSKVCVVSRKEDKKTVHYANISTGNYNENTARFYTDLSLFTADPIITTEALTVFDLLERRIITHNNKHVLLSPTQLRPKMLSLINAEIRNAKAQKPAYIKLKMNSIIDVPLMKKLYQASNAGVKIKLIIRGICGVVPGVKGMSENIEIISILDKYLEHARLFIFCNNNNPSYFIGSADWMVRNLDQRVELTCPVYDNNIQSQLDDLFNIQWNDNMKARWIDKENSNKYRTKTNSETPIRTHFYLHDYYAKKLKEKAL